MLWALAALLLRLALFSVQLDCCVVRFHRPRRDCAALGIGVSRQCPYSTHNTRISVKYSKEMESEEVLAQLWKRLFQSSIERHTSKRTTPLSRHAG